MAGILFLAYKTSAKFILVFTIFGVDLALEIISLASSDQSFISLLEVSGYYKYCSNLIQVKIISFSKFLFWTFLAVKGNKIAIKAT